MATISEKNKHLVKELYYKDFLSARQIAERLGVSIDAVYYFMRAHGFKRRGFSEESRRRFEKKELSFSVNNKLSLEEERLKIIGTILYWGEGYKTSKSNGIDFTNSDPKMITIFVKFLRKICGTDESRLRVLLYCYSNQNTNKLIDFWSNATKIPKRQFSKPYIKFSDNMANNKMPYGLVHIRYYDKKLLLLIKKWIDEYKNKFA